MRAPCKSQPIYTYAGPDAIEVQFYSYKEWRTIDAFKTIAAAEAKAEILKEHMSYVRILVPFSNEEMTVIRAYANDDNTKLLHKEINGRTGKNIIKNIKNF